MAFGNKNSTPSFALTLPMKVTEQDEIFLSKKFRVGCTIYQTKAGKAHDFNRGRCQEEQARQRKAKKKAWQTQMIHEYEMGAKSPELQEKYGISGTLFYRILHTHGKNGRQIHSQNRIETGKKRNAEMVRKYKNGVSVKELAEEYGLKKGSVYRAMKRYSPGPGKSKSCQSEE